jgi:hypothetical protein
MSEVEKETVSQVTKFPRLTTIANNNADVAAELRLLADIIEQGDFGNVDNVVVVLDTDEGVQRYSIGAPSLNRMQVAGLLTWALLNMRSTTGE